MAFRKLPVLLSIVCFSFVLTFWLVLVSVDMSQAADVKFEACAPRSCGIGPSISYPFWVAKEQESYCGYPTFEVSCDDSHAVLAISNDNYIIRDIFYGNYSLILSNAALYEESCPAPQHNFSTQRTLFNYSENHVDLYLFYNCPSKPDAYLTYPIECASNSSHYSFGVFNRDALEETGYALNSCKSTVNVPVDMAGSSSLVNWGNKSYTDILKTGFALNWTSNNCSACANSGGRCGFDNNDFICFCRDGPQHKTCRKGGLDIKTKLIIGFSVCGGTVLIMCAIFFIYQRRRKATYAPSSYFTRNISSDPSSITDPEKIGALYGVKFFTYDELEEATDSFHGDREIGDGGFGTVYLGKLHDGRTVAVKRLYENNYKRVEQFLNEVEILTRLRHKNLVMLYGCTSRHSRELLLVYEYVSNGTIADHLHGRNAKPESLPWGTRLKIVVETASALKYLHASDIIHRDVKTNNILLDDNFNVKVADFGLSRLFPLDVTHVSTAPQGTPGYVDPEYHQCYQLTDKSDVYSFGVVLVELISSKPAVDITRHRHEINLSNMAINKIQNGALQELVDPSLGFDKDSNVQKTITAVAELAFQCLQSDKDMRPTMQEVLEILTRIQCGYSQTEDKAEEMDIFSDEFVLLKSCPMPLSPDSVTVKWNSGSAASNSSG
ncbi:hypothetical protein QQ045_030184 [Rhodiola kirilowii]